MKKTNIMILALALAAGCDRGAETQQDDTARAELPADDHLPLGLSEKPELPELSFTEPQFKSESGAIDLAIFSPPAEGWRRMSLSVPVRTVAELLDRAETMAELITWGSPRFRADARALTELAIARPMIGAVGSMFSNSDLAFTYVPFHDRLTLHRRSTLANDPTVTDFDREGPAVRGIGDDTARLYADWYMNSVIGRGLVSGDIRYVASRRIMTTVRGRWVSDEVVEDNSFTTDGNGVWVNEYIFGYRLFVDGIRVANTYYEIGVDRRGYMSRISLTHVDVKDAGLPREIPSRDYSMAHDRVEEFGDAMPPASPSRDIMWRGEVLSYRLPLGSTSSVESPTYNADVLVRRSNAGHTPRPTSVTVGLVDSAFDVRREDPANIPLARVEQYPVGKPCQHGSHCLSGSCSNDSGTTTGRCQPPS